MEPRAPSGRPPRAEGPGRRVLYVDDELPMVMLVTAQLQATGNSVRGFTVPEEAIDAFRLDAAAFDLVITDYNMPRMSGLRLTEELCRIRADVPVLVTSGYVTDDMRDAATRAGARAIVYKPNSVEELLAAIESVLTQG